MNSSKYVIDQQFVRYEWNTIPWRKVEKFVFKLQKRIYQAAICNDKKKVHKLQRLLLNSISAKLLAVRKVTQDNRGKKTAGIDGKANLNHKERLQLAYSLNVREKAKPSKRVWIPKPGKPIEYRPLGILTISDRAKETLMKMALEPEWEVGFEPNMYGFRPGRSCHDAIEAIFNSLNWKTAYCLDADISGCFDNINQNALLEKLNTTPTFRRIIKGWLRAGVMENRKFESTKRGTIQGGTISPIISNIFMHHVFDMWMRQNYPTMPFERYVDDAIVHCKTQKQAEFIKVMIGKRLAEYKLKLHPEKTQIVYCKDHYRKGEFPKQSFDFLGYTFRPRLAKNKVKGYRVLFMPAISNKAKKKIHQAIKSWKIHRQTSTTMEEISKKVNPIVRGWFQYYGRFYKSEMHPTLRNIERYLIKWARKKYKKLRAHGRLASQFLEKVRKRSPNIFYHWELGQGSKG